MAFDGLNGQLKDILSELTEVVSGLAGLEDSSGTLVDDVSAKLVGLIGKTSESLRWSNRLASSARKSDSQTRDMVETLYTLKNMLKKQQNTIAALQAYKTNLVSSAVNTSASELRQSEESDVTTSVKSKVDGCKECELALFAKDQMATSLNEAYAEISRLQSAQKESSGLIESMRAVLAHKEAEVRRLRGERDALREAEARRERILSQTREVMSAQEMFIDSMSRSRKFNQKLIEGDNAEELYESYLEKRQGLSEREGAGVDDADYDEQDEEEGEPEQEQEDVRSVTAVSMSMAIGSADRRGAGRYNNLSEVDQGVGGARRDDSSEHVTVPVAGADIGGRDGAGARKEVEGADSLVIEQDSMEIPQVPSSSPTYLRPPLPPSFSSAYSPSSYDRQAHTGGGSWDSVEPREDEQHGNDDEGGDEGAEREQAEESPSEEVESEERVVVGISKVERTVRPVLPLEPHGIVQAGAGYDDEEPPPPPPVDDSEDEGDLGYDDDSHEGGSAGLVGKLLDQGVESVDDSFSLIQQYYKSIK